MQSASRFRITPSGLLILLKRRTASSIPVFLARPTPHRLTGGCLPIKAKSRKKQFLFSFFQLSILSKVLVLFSKLSEGASSGAFMTIMTSTLQSGSSHCASESSKLFIPVHHKQEQQQLFLYLYQAASLIICREQCPFFKVG